jgi:hypothetical protein
MSAFGALEVFLDPWEVDHGSELALEQGEDPVEEALMDVEVPSSAWTPLLPAAPDKPGRLLFVDGVRRLEARLLLRHGLRLSYGAFGSYAVGAVRAERGFAVVENACCERLLALGGGESLADAVEVTPALSYQPLATAATEPDAPLRALQAQMRLAEEALARRLAVQPDALVVVDGPLSFGEPSRGAAVGFIKRLFRLYLPEASQDVLSRLPPGARTPLFALRSSRRFARYSWFLRLGPPGSSQSPLSGIVRLEVSAAVGLDGARRLADATARELPRFAPGRGKDPRSPQNLVPIGALEARLRHGLGDARLVRRHIESLLARESRRGR